MTVSLPGVSFRAGNLKVGVSFTRAICTLSMLQDVCTKPLVHLFQCKKGGSTVDQAGLFCWVA